MKIESADQLVEIRIRQHGDDAKRGLSCCGSLLCAEIAPDLLEVDHVLGVCAVRGGVSLSIDGVHYSSGPLPPDLVPQAVEALVLCDSEAAVVVDQSGNLHDGRNPIDVKHLAANYLPSSET